MVVSMAIASGEECGPSYVAKRSLVSITNGSPGWTWRTGGCLALKLVQSWSLVALFMPVSPLLSELFRQTWCSRWRSVVLLRHHGDTTLRGGEREKVGALDWPGRLVQAGRGM